MRIRDWSSDVCSSDLELDDEDGLPALDDPARPLDDRDLVTLDVDLHDGRPQPIPAEGVVEGDQRDEIIGHRAGVLAGDPVRLRTEAGARRSEARRVGQECVSTCRSRWSAGPLKTQ